MSSRRTSTRKRQSSKKYSVDAFEGLELDDDLNDHSFAAQADPEDTDGEGDAEFEADAHASPEQNDDEPFNPADLEPEDLDNDILEQDFEDDESLIGPSDHEKPRFHGPRQRKRPEYGRSKPGRAAADPRFQPRGLLEPATRGSKEVQRLFMFGPTQEDQNPPLQGHFKWSAEPTTPSRKATASGFGGLTRSYFLTADAVKKEAVQDWEWYELDGGKEAFEHRQVCTVLDPTEAQNYMPRADNTGLPFVMGPYSKQRLFRLPVGSSLNLNDAWKPDVSQHEPLLPQDPKSLRNGWMINLGQKVQSLDWAPNHDSPRQFLAVCTVPVTETRTEEPPYASSSAPAFTPQPPYKSSIQIWEFMSSSDGHVSLKTLPKLRKVICTNWGDVKSLKWCPAPRKFDSSSQPDETSNLGLMAVLFGDGSIRVVDISVSTSSEKPTEYVHMQAAAFVTRPPNTICTCLTWLSSTSIAAGCANGSVGVWNVSSSLTGSSTETEQIAEPVVYASLATTYVLAVTSCYPSRPHILLATTMAGHLYMIDLLDMPSSTTFGPATTIRSTRSRIGRSILVWHDWSQMVLSSDDNFTLIAYPLRRFFRQIGCTRYKSPALAVSVSPVHPFVVAGCAGGEVTCNNPLRRAYESKVPIWNQTWFSHEWRSLKPGERLNEDDAAMDEADAENDESNTGMSRILEGHKCELIKLFNTEDSFTHREGGTIYTTVYELKTSITTVCWNPNIHVGGWVAAGMASGLLRVEDIAS